MTNAFVKSLSAYTQIQISASNKSCGVHQNQVYISNLQDALDALTPAKPTTPTTIKPGTTTPTVKRQQGQAANP